MIRPLWIATAFLLAIIGLGVAGSLVSPAEAGPLFRIIDVRAEHGHLIVEAQHYNTDGSHWFYENYTFQGREEYKRPRVTDQFGSQPEQRLFLKSDGRVAPARYNPSRRIYEHYLPDGEEWLRHNYPHLAEDSFTDVIQSTHAQRVISGWTRGTQRLTTHPLDFTAEDAAGADRLAARFAGLRNAGYRRGVKQEMLAYSGPLPAIDPYVSSAWGTTSTFYPSLDGTATRAVADEGEVWNTIHGGSGTTYSDTSATPQFIKNQMGTISNQFNSMIRGFFLFDTSGLGDSDIIDSATFGLVGVSGGLSAEWGGNADLVQSTTGSTTALAAADYQGTVGNTTLQATSIAFSSLVADDSSFNTWTLNATGEGNINKTGITYLGLRGSYDTADTQPTYISQYKQDTLTGYSAEEGVPGDVRPKLVINHTTPSAAITGTIGDGATEQEVRDGGGTIIITLTGDTWVAAGGTFDAQRQGIIDGLDSAQSETYGWNAEVRDKTGVGAVVRTSGTIVTITLVASEVADYRVDSAETITMTVPGASLTSGSGMTATPTIAITAASESMAVSGTLGASGGTAAEIRTGGETVILTLSNTEWVASGATFNAERQNIIDGLDSNQSDPNGWDIRRADFAVGDVVRTSATIVTITLSASSAYAIAQTETITAVAPASAVVYGAAITGSPSFDISTTFQLSGNRVSGPINLSSITDVAYCAIGWEATTPTDTTVSVETSVDGGASYSSATNGSCPTGLTVGTSLGAITDFRIKVSLTTNDNTVTPLVEGAGLLVQDTAGPALYYQLNTTPGVTITDRSANSNAGTMSFPVSQTGVNATTGVLESTRSTLSLEQLLSVGDIVSPVTGAAASTNMFNQTETGFGSLPFQDLMQTMATGGELPLKFVWVVAIGLFSIALGVVALHMTGSLMISGIGLGAGLSIGAAIGGGLIPGWTIILFVILALALVVMRSRGALPL